jgi:predicted transcriptional regulator
MTIDRETLLTLTADIAAAHVSNNHVAAGDVGGLIASIHGALAQLRPAVAAPEPEQPKRAVSIRASIKPDGLISMIDGKRYKILRGHLGRHGYTPESYRATFRLPLDYPMVAAEYAQLRRDLARKIGLGRKRKVSKPRTSRAIDS